MARRESPFFTSELEMPALEMQVLCDVRGSEIAAIIHVVGQEDRCYGELFCFADERGIVIETRQHERSVQEVVAPTAPNLKSHLLLKIQKLARRWGVRPETAVFREMRSRAPLPGFQLPAAWIDPAALRRFNKSETVTRRMRQYQEALPWLRQGVAHLDEERFRKAMHSFKTARQLSPEFHASHLMVGRVLARERRWHQAEEALIQAQDLVRANRLRLKKSLLQEDAKAIENALAFVRMQRAVEKVAVPPQENAQPRAQAPTASALDTPSFENVFSDAVRQALGESRYGSLDQFRLRLEAEQLRLLGSFEELLAPSRCHIQIYEHQIRTAQIALRRMRGRALLGDEVGLGKSIEAGLILKEYLLRGMVSKALILVVPALLRQWREELREKFEIPSLLVDSLEDAREASALWKSPGVTIASLALAKREPHRSMILEQEYDLVILDEAHHVRNRSTVGWQFLNQIKKKYLLLLTATPLQNDLTEIYNLVTLLRPGQLGSPTDFNRQFRDKGRVAKNTEALRTLLRDVMIRHTRATVAVKLPRRIAKTLSVALSAGEQLVYEQLSNFVRQLAREAGPTAALTLTTLQREAGSSSRAVLATLTKLSENLPAAVSGPHAALCDLVRATPDGARAEALRRLLSHLSGHCLVYTEFRETLHYLAEALKEVDLEVHIFHGGLTPAQKAAALADFERAGGVLLSTPAGSEGANLQFCRQLINFDLPWNPMRIEQRIGRLHRIGQTGDVLIYNLYAPGTVEDYLLRILNDKLNLFELVVGETETVLGELSGEKDFERLLMDAWLGASDTQAVEEGMSKLGESVAARKKEYLEGKKFGETIFGKDYERV